MFYCKGVRVTFELKNIILLLFSACPLSSLTLYTCCPLQLTYSLFAHKSLCCLCNSPCTAPKARNFLPKVNSLPLSCVSSMALPQNRQKLANFKWLIESHLEPEGLVEKDYFHTFNQNLIKMYMNTKRFILTTWFFPHSLPFGFFP